MTAKSTETWFLSLQNWWRETRSSFWFVPATLVVGAVILAAGMVAIDANTDLQFVSRWPLLFGAGAAGSRGLLTGVAGSMITVAGVVFSITIVALALTSSQYTSRVLRNFMRDKFNQLSLGVFVGIFAYCLVVLRTVRGGDEGAFVPSLAVLLGLLLAFVGIAFLIFFIHHISISIQASSIIAAAADETVSALDRLFPEGIGEGADENFSGFTAAPCDETWSAVPSRFTGYVESVDGDALLAFAAKKQLLLRMERGVGEFVVEGTPLVSVCSAGLDDEAVKELNTIYLIGRYRTVEQDAGFGIRQIVDVALKALSPGVNDTTTAVMCVDYLTAILVRLAPRQIAASQRFHDGKLRLIARGPSFEGLLGEAFDQIRQNAERNVAVITRQLQSLVFIAGAVTHPARQNALRKHIIALSAVAERTVLPQDRAEIDALVEQLRPITFPSLGAGRLSAVGLLQGD